MLTIDQLPTPFYIVYEDRLRRNLQLISDVSRRTGADIIMAFKANALWRAFPIIKDYTVNSTASSVNEMLLANEFLGGEVHTYCPAYTDETIPIFLNGSSHITFNSLSQFERFYPKVDDYNRCHPDRNVSVGLRVNPQCSVIETDIYNPALPGSRFGVTVDMLPDRLPSGLDGFHFHALCESDSHDLAKVLASFEQQFGRWFNQLSWINMGGGHLITRADYDVEFLVTLLNKFKCKYPWLKIILEPGSAFTWRTGDLITSVVDIVDNQGIKTAIIDTSFACHMPDCLEMPYKPVISESVPTDPTRPTYRLGGNSCLSGDYVGDWSFASPLFAGQRLSFEDMNHYTTVKTTMFNGIQHPDIVLCHSDGQIEYLRRFTYDDYKSRMS